MRKILGVMFVLGISTVGAMAQSKDVAPLLPATTTYTEYSPTRPPSAPNGDNTIVCNYQRETGSLFVTRVCRTLRAWKLMQADAREFMDYGERGATMSADPLAGSQ